MEQKSACMAGSQTFKREWAYFLKGLFATEDVSRTARPAVAFVAFEAFMKMKNISHAGAIQFLRVAQRNELRKRLAKKWTRICKSRPFFPPVFNGIPSSFLLLLARCQNRLVGEGSWPWLKFVEILVERQLWPLPRRPLTRTYITVSFKCGAHFVWN